ncbi:MAG: hypothetical protein H0W64_10780 [Gammaproteobacteria bacterium]|nr:hypothetical protein [Gammaproteobacteria bacterium]
MLPQELAKKTLDLLTPKIGPIAALELAARLETNSTELLLGKVNTTLLLRECLTGIVEVTQNLMKETLSHTSIHDTSLMKPLDKLLAKYTADPKKRNEIAEATIALIKTNFKEGDYPFHLEDDVVKDFIYDELRELDETLKEVDYEIFFFDYVNFFEAYANLVLNVLDKNESTIKKPLEELLYTTIAPVSDIIDQQDQLLKSYTYDLTQFVLEKLTPFRRDLTSLKCQYFDAKMSETFPDFKSIFPDRKESELPTLREGDRRKLTTEALQFAENLCLEVEDNWMNDAITEWCKINIRNAPIFRELLDFNAIKANARYIARYNETATLVQEQANKITTEMQSITANPRCLTANELNDFAVHLSNYLTRAKQKGLAQLFSPEVELALNPENRKFYMDTFQFKQFIELLPEKITQAFIYQESNVPFKADQLKQLGLDKWQESDAMIKACSEFLNYDITLTNAETYLKWHTEKLEKKALKHQHNEAILVEAEIDRSLKSANSNRIDPIKEKSLLAAESKNNKLMFSTIINNTNLPTARAVLEKLQAKENTGEYIALLQTRMKKIEKVKHSLKLFGKQDANDKFASPTLVNHARLGH